MEGAAFIPRVVLENYKSVAHCDVRLGPRMYLVGANGAGKSNFLDSLRFIADSLNSSLDVAVRERGGLEVTSPLGPGEALPLPHPPGVEPSRAKHRIV